MAKKQISKDVIETGDNIREMREAAGMTQSELGIAVDMPYNSISRYELGEVEMGIGTLFKIAEGLHTTPDKLAPERFQEKKETDPRLDELSELFSKLDENSKQMAFQSIEAMLIGFGAQNNRK